MRLMYLNRSQKIGMRNWITHNFFNFDRNIGMLHLKTIVLMKGIHQNENISNLSNPVLTTTRNDKKIAHF